MKTMEISSRICFVLLGSFLSSPIFECKKLDGYEFPVYTTKFCPKNQTEWNERSSAISCNESNGYLCLPNENITELLEFCYIHPFIWIQEGLCLYLNKRYSRVNSKACQHFQSGCPNSSHQSIRNFQYPSCLEIGNGCFVAEPSCNSKTNNFQDATKATQTENYTFNDKDSETTNDNNSIDSVQVLLSSLSGVVLMVYVICNLFFCFRKRQLKKIERNDSTELHLLSQVVDNYSWKETSVSLLITACKNGQDIIVQRLLKSGANVNLCAENGKTLLHFACENGHDSTAQLLLNNGADINACTKNGATPLHFACENGHDSTAQLLLNNGANINSRTENGATLLHFACENGHDSTAQLLLNNGADINVCTENGYTPLHLA
nr:ankyrin repeat and protein kinase domain-containing protein 1 isoform X2 [Crassostrea gigas]